MTDQPDSDTTIETTPPAAPAPQDATPAPHDASPAAAATAPADGHPQLGRRTVVLLALCVAALGFAGGIAGFLAADEWRGDDEPGPFAAADPFQPSNDDDDDERRGDVQRADDAPADGLTPREIYRRVGPAVVHIDATVTVRESSIFGQQVPREAEGAGSGFVIDEDGHIVTNAHVVEGAETLSVSFGEGVEVEAELIGLDRSTDIAVIKVDPDSDELDGGTVRTVRFGDSRAVRVGDPVVAIGNPFELDRTLTTGVVSALQREIPALNDFRITDVIQTDAAINPGNSGGPLLNMRGEVIGVNSQIQSRTGAFAGIAFAVPSLTVERVVEDLIKDGEVEHAWLGVAGQDVTPEIADALNLPVKEGVIVGEVTPGSPAAKAGIEGGSADLVIEGTGIRPGGDIITSFDGERLETMRELAELVDQKQPGDKVEIEFLQDGDERRETVTLGDRPESLDRDTGSRGE